MLSKTLSTILTGSSRSSPHKPFIMRATRGNSTIFNPNLVSQVGSSQEKKVHIIGYPFAGGQGKSGPELSPGWLFRQDWLQSLEDNAGVSVEMVAVSNPKPNSANDKDIVEGHKAGRKNWNNVLNSS